MKKNIKIGILSVAMVQLMATATNAGLADVSRNFPNASTMMLQLSQNIGGMIGMFVALSATKIYSVFGRKRCVIIGLLSLIVLSVAGFLYHPSMKMVCFYNIVQGIATSLYIPAIGAAIIDFFDGNERTKMVGSQNSFVSIGSIVISFVGALLSSYRWYYIYLVFLLSLPALILAYFFFPEDKENEEVLENEKPIISKNEAFVILRYILFTLLTNIVNGTINSNLALYIAEKGFGSSVLTGTIGSVLNVVGIINGFCFGHFFYKIEDHLFTLAVAAGAICYYILSVTGSLPVAILSIILLNFINGMILPRSLLTLSRSVDGRLSTFTSGLICSVIPNVSGFLSFFIITGISDMIYGVSNCSDRFRIASLGSAALFMVFSLTISSQYFMKKNKNE